MPSESAEYRAKRVWKTFEKAAVLPVGATGRELDAAEATLGFALPELVREVFRVHNGIGVRAYDDRGYANASPLLSIEDSVDAWRLLSEEPSTFPTGVVPVRGPVRAMWWNPRWVPISSNGGGDAYCIDVDPAPGGNVGQIVTFWHDDDHRKVVSPDIVA